MREARRASGLTQQRLAELSGLQRQHLSAIENGRLLLTDERARKVASHLGTHPAALVVGHAASTVSPGPNKPSVGVSDFHELVRAFSVARDAGDSNPRLRLDLIRAVGEMSDDLFAAWRRLLAGAERDAERFLEVRPR